MMNAEKVQELAIQLLNEDNVVIANAIRTQIKEYYATLSFKTIGQTRRQAGFSYLGSINSSAKIVKNATKNYDTYIVYLAPHTMSGHNTCAKASEGCISACLNTSGRVRIDTKNSIQRARLLRTLLFYGNREVYNKLLFAEIESAKKKAKKNGHKFSVRLNGTSDLSPKLFNVSGVNVLDKFKGVQFYDYTKVYNRMKSAGKNYHLTFSYSGDNMNEVVQALDNGYNVAVPFLVKPKGELPQDFLGHKVGDADKTDLRFLDELRIAGLRVKMTKDKSAVDYAVKQGFVIDPQNFDINKLKAAGKAA